MKNGRRTSKQTNVNILYGVIRTSHGESKSKLTGAAKKGPYVKIISDDRIQRLSYMIEGENLRESKRSVP